MLGPENIVSFDTETHCIQPGLLAPPLVCISYASSASVNGIVLDKHESVELLHEILSSNELLCGANIAYDMAVMSAYEPQLLPFVFAKYDRGEIFDVLIAQELDAIANGNLFRDPRTAGPLRSPSTGKKSKRYSLEIVVYLVLGVRTAKSNDFWRKRYAILDRVPMPEWPMEARQYPADDARNTREVALAQLGFSPRVGLEGLERSPLRNLQDMPAQARAAWALHLGAVRGLRTNAEKVESLARKVEIESVARKERFQVLGLVRPDGTEDGAEIKKRIVVAYGVDPVQKCEKCGGAGRVVSPVSGNSVSCGPRNFPGEATCDGTGIDLSGVSALPRTDKGAVSADRDTLVESGDEILADYGDNEIEKIRETYVPFLREGTYLPISLRPNVLVASGRTSYDGLVQLLPRGGGVRECFVARSGYVFCSVDYASLELCTLAQVCLDLIGFSEMAGAINAGRDLHSQFGAAMAGVSYEEFLTQIKGPDAKRLKEFRQATKAANFGFPGGMGAPKLVLAKRREGLRLCEILDSSAPCGTMRITEHKGRVFPPLCKRCVELAEKLRGDWFAQWPEMREYFAYVSKITDGIGEIEQLRSKRVRGGVGFCDGANTYFQGLAADGAKHALWMVSKECHTDSSSPLWGAHPIVFAHDEIIAEMPEDRAHLAGPRMAEVMVAAMREWVPDVVIKAEPCLMRHWYKDAAPAYRDGKLIPWEDRDAKG